jgi:2-keto-4-pentenoate hydratase/2-oxohepta-3-ene-1,7-dioic acid hydratase in catechol pathway
MKVAVFGPERRVGVVEDDTIVDINAVYDKYLAETPGAANVIDVPATLNAFIEAGDAALEGARAAMKFLATQPDSVRGTSGEQLRYAISDVTLHPPIEGASRIFAALANFADHMQAAAANAGATAAAETLAKLQAGGPKYFMKDARCASTDGDPVRYPARTEHMDYEAEVAVVIGKPGRDIESQDVRSHIWGYTLANDWSVRDHVSFGPDFQYSKNFDTAAGLGPWIVVDENIDPQDIPIECRVNGEVRQSGSTRSMIHDFAAMGAFLSRDTTLYPGDMILSGTPKGTAVDSSKRLDDGSFPDDSRFIKPGDVVEVSSTLLGSLTNAVVKPTRLKGATS